MLLGLASGLFSWIMAAVIYSTRPDRVQNRLLAIFLFLAGATWLTFDAILQVMASPEGARWAMVAMMCLHVAAHYFHLLFLSTLPSRLVRPLRLTWVRVGLGLVALVWIAHILARPALWTSGVEPTTYVARWTVVPGPLFTRFWWVLDTGWWFGLAVAITAYAQQQRWRDNRQAKAYLAAFTVHDGGFAILLAIFLLQLPTPAIVSEFMGFVPWPILNIWLTSLLAYGILRTQLFDIDLRIKRGMAKGTVAAGIAAIFLVASELTERTLPASGTMLAILAAGIVALAFRPLERHASRLVDRVMPATTESEEYVGGRKGHVYRAAVEELLVDGELSSRDAEILAALRQRLGIAEDVARSIEERARGSTQGRVSVVDGSEPA